MIPLDDEFITEEQRQILIDLRATTCKLLRAFSKREYALLLDSKAFKQSSADFTKFNETILNLEKLYESYMTTPLEEVISVKKSLKELEIKVQTLNETRDSKRDQLDKHIEECNKSKEVRNMETSHLAEKRRTEQVEKDTQINEAVEKGKRDEADIQESHKVIVEDLTKQH